METRKIEEAKVYALVLNPMRANTETRRLVAISYERAKLIDWYNSQLAEEPYVDEGPSSFECQGNSHNWHKTFKKGSELEWFNPVGSFEPDHFGHGIDYQWIEPREIDPSIRMID